MVDDQPNVALGAGAAPLVGLTSVNCSTAVWESAVAWGALVSAVPVPVLVLVVVAHVATTARVASTSGPLRGFGSVDLFLAEDHWRTQRFPTRFRLV